MALIRFRVDLDSSSLLLAVEPGCPEYELLPVSLRRVDESTRYGLQWVQNSGLKGVIFGFQLSFVGRFVIENYALVPFGLLVSLAAFLTG